MDISSCRPPSRGDIQYFDNKSDILYFVIVPQNQYTDRSLVHYVLLPFEGHCEGVAVAVLTQPVRMENENLYIGILRRDAGRRDGRKR